MVIFLCHFNSLLEVENPDYERIQHLQNHLSSINQNKDLLLNFYHNHEQLKETKRNNIINNTLARDKNLIAQNKNSLKERELTLQENRLKFEQGKKFWIAIVGSIALLIKLGLL